MWAAAAVAAAVFSSGCLVISLQPIYEDQTVAFDEGLLGRWRNAEDNVEVTVERGEWRSYKIHYKHPVEEADFTARLTAIGDAHYLDLMPVRGLDYGVVLIPAHLPIKVERSGEKWLVTAPDYDRFRASLKAGKQAAFATFDQRQNVVLTGSTTELRAWLRDRGEDDFTAPATFERIDK